VADLRVVVIYMVNGRYFFGLPFSAWSISCMYTIIAMVGVARRKMKIVTSPTSFSTHTRNSGSPCL